MQSYRSDQPVHNRRCPHSDQAWQSPCIVQEKAPENASAGGENITDAIFLRNYLIDQGYDIPPVTVYQDNQAAIRLMENGFTSSSRTRHIDIRYFFIKDRIENGDIKIEYLHTKQMIADFLTKPLVGELFYRLRDLLLGYATL